VQAERAQWRLTAGQLLVVDEASLAGTLALASLTSQAISAGAKLLLVGDHHQLSAVDAGGAFGLLARRTRTVELADLWRFTNRWGGRRHSHPA
jgi:ATP-dependent exoDNAse (exonuclease V) alpha subunit